MFNKKNKLDPSINYLELTPIPQYNHEIKEDGKIDVLVPKFTDKILSKLFMSRIKSPFIKANLDEIGSATWLLLDGNNNVESIIEKMNDRFGESINPPIERITAFLTQLYRNGFITFLEINKGEK